MAVRIPGWYTEYRGETVKGYAYFDLRDGESLEFDFKMKPKLVEARAESVFDCGRYAVMRGPVVYCMEGHDNGELLRDIRLDGRARFVYGKHETLQVPKLTVKAYRRAQAENTPLYTERHDSLETIQATLIPYYAFANRGESAMQVWHLVK